MHRLLHVIPAVLSALAVVGGGALAAGKGPGYEIRVTSSDFDAAIFGLENAIVNRGLVIDAVGHVSNMLERTAKATGGATPYIAARYLSFCSAKLSQAAMHADPENLAICPYVVFAYELKSEPGKARIGFRRPAASDAQASQKVVAEIEKLLTEIVREAVE